MPKFLPDVHEVREDVNDYLGECLAFDAGLGVIIERLEAAGELDNTLFVITSDHGEEFFDHGSVSHGMSLYEEQLRVPLLLYQAGRF
ncbi:MAG: sulfatase-like hydrolase/transferase, partial [SAR202 cluster bacterium]|nr:sulfatase-like hydrolase/transferase [SAR202 cluster bacterium]